jgi:predicted nucleic-acid-binding protein
MLYVVYIIQYINTLINIEYVYYIQHGEDIPYRNTTIQYINTLINIEYVHYIPHGEVIHTEIQLYIHILYLLMYLCIV